MAAKAITESGITEIELVQGDITNLAQLPSIQLSETFSGFDIITALWTFGGILKSQKQAVLAHWSAFLAPGGRIVVDHEHYYRDVATLERRHVLGGEEQKEGLADAKSWKECRQQLQQLAKSAGLVTKTMERLNLPADYPDNTEWSKQAREVWKREGGKDIQPSRAYMENRKRMYVEEQRAKWRAQHYFVNHKIVAVVGILTLSEAQMEESKEEN
ncbi:hypothetical protein MMC14_010686 [Varicellaria rhodocarpa]|nr:hypothetical protein [Varicellaria rhodocarpa]